MRPTEIAWFERIVIATLVLGALNSWLAWPQLVALGGTAFLITVQVFTLGIILLLTLLISRRGSNVAKWISVALFVLGLPFSIQDLAAGTALGSPIISIAQLAAQAVAFALLFTPASRRWFNRAALRA